jgi:plastocyanin
MPGSRRRPAPRRAARVPAALLALLLGLLLTACGGETTDDGANGEATPGTNGEATPGTNGEATPGADDGTAETEVLISNFTFGPGTLTIDVGTTVTWRNEDTAPHTATADDGSFDSGSLAQGETFSHTFDTAGTYRYICTIHPSMVGEITVE